MTNIMATRVIGHYWPFTIAKQTRAAYSYFHRTVANYAHRVVSLNSPFTHSHGRNTEETGILG